MQPQRLENMKSDSGLTAEQVTKHHLSQQAALTAYAYCVSHDYHLAEDVFQDVCVKAVARCTEFESLDHLSNWFRASSRNRTISLMRSKEGRYVGLSPEMLAVIETEWSSKPAATDPRSEALFNCLDRLPERSRRIMKMRYLEGQSGDVIAEFLGGKVESAYQAITRIHKALRECVQQQLKTQP